MLSVCHKYFSRITTHRFADLSAQSQVARIAGTVEATGRIGALLSATRLNLTLVNVIAFLVVGLIPCLVSIRTEANASHWRTLTVVRAAAVLYAAVIATTERALVTAVRTLDDIVAELGTVYAHVHAAAALELGGG